MRRLLYMLIMLAGVWSFTGCEKSPDLPTLTDAEYPRILGRWPEKNGDVLGEFGAQVGVDFTIEVQFTPSNLSAGTWYLDGVEYCKGTIFRYQSGQPVTHNIKLVVTTPKYTTTREAVLKVTN